MVHAKPEINYHQAIYCVIPGRRVPFGVADPGSSALGWQSLFATETGGLFQAGNSVASAGQTSAAPKLHIFLLSTIYSSRSTYIL
jgi:hypothetical protein